MTEPHVARRISDRPARRYYLRLGLVGFRWSRRARGPDGARAGGREGLGDEGRDAGGHRPSASRSPARSRSRSAFWLSYLRGGFWGAWAGGWAFILPNFVIVRRWPRCTSTSAACRG